MPLTHRTERIAEQLREEVSQILATEVADPGVGLVTVSRVKVTPDLSLARVYWTILGNDEERKKTTKALQRAASFVRRVLAGRVTLRRVPEVVFQYRRGAGRAPARRGNPARAARAGGGAGRGRLTGRRRGSRRRTTRRRPSPADDRHRS